MNQPTDYSEIPGLEHIALEESYVLAIHLLPERFVITLELVLLPGHPAYSQPASSEMYCYRLGSLVFPSPRSLRLQSEKFHKIPGLDEPADVGNIDSMQAIDGQYQLQGEWGELTIVSEKPVVHLDESQGARL
ncbi:MAG: hypothetical protein HOQ30_17135 [Gemmatimonadaceae bacterium]|nr:hypothetical protein [Gemmatimonadaceae bacterium]